MMNLLGRFGILVLLIVVGSSAQGAKPSRQEDYWSALTESSRRMHSAMDSVQRSGDSDADFVKLMLPHHQAAIDMAKAQLSYGRDPQIRRLAQEIITDQQSEVDLMRLWLKQHSH